MRNIWLIECIALQVSLTCKDPPLPITQVFEVYNFEHSVVNIKVHMCLLL